MIEPLPTHRISLPIRLSGQHQRWVYSGFTLLWLSGVLWLLFHYFLQTPGSFGPQPHVLEPWWLRLHGLAMMLTLVLAGTTIIHHAHKSWRLGKNRLMGGLLAGCMGWLAISGYALYYFSTDGNAAWLPLLHWLPGLSMPLVIGLHVRKGRARAKSRTVAGVQHCHQTPTPMKAIGEMT